MKSIISYENILTNSPIELSGENVFFVTDTNVIKLYEQLFSKKNVYVFEAGEQSKNINTVLEICDSMLKNGCNRKTVLVAVGGGVVGDIAGFAASIYMRGIEWINVPTTLLAQVDSSIGGKTGVDFSGYKNILGAFNMPKKIIICSEFLSSLPQREWICGMGEVVKTAMLKKSIFAFLADNFSLLMAREEIALKNIVRMCSLFKEGVTSRDFLEQGERKNLNIGHTVGHALESANNYEDSHGEYVLWGIRAENYFFKNQIDSNFYYSVACLIDELLRDKKIKFDSAVASKLALGDKKNHDNKISVITCLSAGKTAENTLSQEEFCKSLENWRNSL